MNTASEPHLACHHSGIDFDWWRCNQEGYVGRPPSPFPASFETPRVYRSDSADTRYEIQTLPHKTHNNTNGVVVNGPNSVVANGPNGACTNGTAGAGNTLSSNLNNERYKYDDGGINGHRLHWPLYQGHWEQDFVQPEDFGNIDTSGLTNKGKKTPRLAHKRPPWVPSKMPNKWGVTGHPPPYTNYCKETLFNTRTANPAKVTIKTTF
uniref:Uncharacterized protein n=1 Tax=Arion vulgaris TaxID=1028688 RepID=A0A0B7B5U1_9EUPU